MRELLIGELDAISGGIDVQIPMLYVMGQAWGSNFGGAGGGAEGGSDWDTNRGGDDGSGYVSPCAAIAEMIFIDHIRDVIGEANLSHQEIGTVLYGFGENMRAHNAISGSLGELTLGETSQAGLPYFVDLATTITGSIHNHPSGSSQDQLLDRYPSNNIGADDWNAADQLVAAGADGGSLVVYIIDPFGEVRGFPYTMKDYYMGLSEAQRSDGVGLPAPMIDDDGQLAALATSSGCGGG